MMREGLYVIEKERICYSRLVVRGCDVMEYKKRWKMVIRMGRWVESNVKTKTKRITKEE